MRTVHRLLVAKEVYLNRWLVAFGAGAGVVSAFVASLGLLGFNVGVLTWITTVIAAGVMLIYNGVVSERKERALLFILSLPLSPAGYVRAKVAGLGLAFLGIWGVSTAAAVVLVLADPDIPDGMLPYTLLLAVYLLVNFAVLLGCTLVASSEAAVTAAIIGTNMSVSLYMFTVGGIGDIGANFQAAHPVWSGSVWGVLTVELVVLALALVLPLVFAARRRDFV